MDKETIAIGLLPVRLLGYIETAEGETKAIALQVDTLDEELQKKKVKIWVDVDSLFGPLPIDVLNLLGDILNEPLDRIHQLSDVSQEEILICPSCKSDSHVFANPKSGEARCDRCQFTDTLRAFMTQWEGKT